MSLLVIGHSFVHRLEESLGATVSATYRDVTIKGIGGLTVDRLTGMLPSPGIVKNSQKKYFDASVMETLVLHL